MAFNYINFTHKNQQNTQNKALTLAHYPNIKIYKNA
ncbi:hypothetical protein HNP25_002265 [Arcicella rosea]|uniref:Uncharacterized protein n=1 Tax=Arcicella rosea TaxID=502909 RepID=A0A841EHD9_9BACT|nr:hypothetical protein [Arcicella rosea]